LTKVVTEFSQFYREWNPVGCYRFPDTSQIKQLESDCAENIDDCFLVPGAPVLTNYKEQTCSMDEVHERDHRPVK